MDRKVFLSVVLGIAATTITAHAQSDNDPLVDVVAGGKGRINYSAGVIKATGSGAPPSNANNLAQARLMALGAARADALRNLAMAVSSVQVTSSTRVKNFVTESDIIETKLSAILQGARVVSEVLGRDGIATVTVEMPLYGKESVASVVMPVVAERAHKHRGGDAPVRQPEPEPEPAAPAVVFKEPTNVRRITPEPKRPAPRPKYRALAPTSPSEEGPFSAVIVDCRGLNIQAIMSPKLYDASGREVYGTMEVDTDYAIEYGIVGYPRSADEALSNKRAGDHPLIVQAVKAKDKFRMDPVISVADGERILNCDKQSGFLNKCRVIFLCDPVK